MPKCHHEQFCMWKECFFQTVKMKQTKNNRRFWWLVIWMNRSFRLFITFDFIYQFHHCFSLNSLTLSELGEILRK
jgi:hypothetical protein